MTRIALASLALLASAARADRPVIDLSGAKVQAYPIALAPPLGNAELAGNVEGVLAQDLDRSGLFRLLNPASFLASPTEPLDKVEFGKWQPTGAGALVKMSCEPAPEPRCDFRLYDVQRGARLLAGSYRGNPRQLAHRFADDVV
jgi:TolB protein